MYMRSNPNVKSLIYIQRNSKEHIPLLNRAIFQLQNTILVEACFL